MSNDLKCLPINFYLLTMFDELGDVFYNVYKRFLNFCHVFTFLTFFIFIGTFFTSMDQGTISHLAKVTSLPHIVRILYNGPAQHARTKVLLMWDQDPI